MDKRAESQWKKSDISYQNYQNYLSKKADRYELTFIDLLYISNFKGGNSTINEIESEINTKLIQYSVGLRNISDHFNEKSLEILKEDEVELLISKVQVIIDLTKKGSENKIDGFSVSYLSALLNAYFPNLIPILDRRLLFNLELVTKPDKDSQDQIKNIQKFYKTLIIKMSELIKEKGETIREVDRRIFSEPLKNNVN
ncbi:MAG: hypothetical protein WCP85_04795 [Mariniphaga sp.]